MLESIQTIEYNNVPDPVERDLLRMMSCYFNEYIWFLRVSNWLCKNDTFLCILDDINQLPYNYITVYCIPFRCIREKFFISTESRFNFTDQLEEVLGTPPEVIDTNGRSYQGGILCVIVQGFVSHRHQPIKSVHLTWFTWEKSQI